MRHKLLNLFTLIPHVLYGGITEMLHPSDFGGLYRTIDQSGLPQYEKARLKEIVTNERYALLNGEAAAARGGGINMRLYTITQDRIRKFTRPHGGKYPHHSKFDSQLCAQGRPWREGIDDETTEIWRPLLVRRYGERSGIRLLRNGDSYIIPTVVGTFCIARPYFHQRVLRDDQ